MQRITLSSPLPRLSSSADALKSCRSETKKAQFLAQVLATAA
ncbi:MAG TPA: hypothetical protein VGM17_12425 [Rhizomicrobium sp.]|jgi:hypothetical protein